ncbi:MAG: glycosyltransferase family 4 protein [Deltaproteobacteria bacterium]|nr:glycosyltransferase family 4 protein [Deltaproteobacteria bacterium]
MKILFTQFTPPFAQIHTSLIGKKTEAEKKYLNFRDWYSDLRRFCAQNHTVALVSLTNKREVIELHQDGYQSLFFPVLNPNEKVINGRWNFFAPDLIEWLEEFDPDVVHIVGSGHRMAQEVLNNCRTHKTFIWDRTQFHNYKSHWEELHKARYLVSPSQSHYEQARHFFPENKFLIFPLGINLEHFKKLDNTDKKYNIMTVGSHKRKKKNIILVEKMARKRGLSWLHMGSVRRGWPYTKVEDLFFFQSLRSFLNVSLLKRCSGFSHVSGYSNHESMPILYNQCKILVHPSESEGAPRCVYEALACEVPVVVLKQTVPSIEPEFGIACESHEECEEAVLRLLSNESRRKKMGKNGRDWLLANHTPQKLYEAVEKSSN